MVSRLLQVNCSSFLLLSILLFSCQLNETLIPFLFFFLLLALFCRQIDRDCEFLEQERIMDYSLLVGLHFRNTSAAGDLIPSGALTPTGY